MMISLHSTHACIDSEVCPDGQNRSKCMQEILISFGGSWEVSRA